MRTIRTSVPGVVYHLISRFANGHWFMKGDEERTQYLSLLGRGLSDSDWSCISFALMSSHVHLGVIAGESPLESWAKRAHTPFAMLINAREERFGSVFARGPKDHAVPPHRIGALIAYIHNNPVRAGVVESPAESTWTSHRAYLGTAAAPRWLQVDKGLALSELATVKEFDAWVRTNPEDPSRELVGLRRRGNELGQFEFGTPTSDGRIAMPLLGRPWTATRIDPRWVVAVTAAIFNVERADLSSRSRSPVIVAARRIAIHAAIALGVSGYDIGITIGLSKSAVSKIKLTKLDGVMTGLQQRVIERVRQLTGNSTLSPTGDEIPRR